MTPRTAWDLGVLTGDGIGPEVVGACVRVVGAALAAEGSGVRWHPLPMGRDAIDTHGAALPAGTTAALADLDGWVAGPHDSLSYPEPHRSALSPSGALRKQFGLWANIRPATSIPGRPPMDLVIVRENTEGFYSDRNTFRGGGEWMPTPDVAVTEGIVTRPAVERIVRTAFGLAASRRGHLTVVHKANVLRLTTGMFLDVADAVAPEYPDVVVDDLLVDAAAAALVRRPQDFDVLVTENMFGDILSDLTAEISGSLGCAGGLNASERTAMAQPAHGSAPDIAGTGTADPVAMIRSGAMLLEWLGATHGSPAARAAARRIGAAVTGTLEAGILTPDLGGTADGDEVTSAVVDALSRGAAGPPTREARGRPPC